MGVGPRSTSPSPDPQNRARPPNTPGIGLWGAYLRPPAPPHPQAHRPSETWVPPVLPLTSLRDAFSGTPTAAPPPPPLWRVPLCCGVWLPPHTPPRGARMTLLKQCPGSAHPSGQLLVPCAHGWCGGTYSLLWSNEAGGVERAGNRGIAVRGCHRGTDVPKTEKEYSKRSTRTVI